MHDKDVEWYRQLLGATTDEYYLAKFLNGELIAGWDFHQRVKERTAGIIPFGTRTCHAALRK